MFFFFRPVPIASYTHCSPLMIPIDPENRLWPLHPGACLSNLGLGHREVPRHFRKGRSGMGRWDTHFLRVSKSIYIYISLSIYIYIYINTYNWISHWMGGPRPPFICRFHWISLGQLIAIGKREHTHMVF